MSSSSDETYLEAFIESLATLPHEVRRNMDLLKDLDASCALEIERLQQLQRRYILAAEEKMLRLQVVEMVDTDDDDEDEEGDGDGVGDDSDPSTGSTDNNPQKKKAAALLKYGVRVLNEDGSSSSSNPKNDAAAAVVIPTTDELMAYTYHAETYAQIRRLQQTCRQKSDEKVAVARQAYERIDAQVQRLDADLVAMEALLQAQGEYGYGTTSSGTAGGGLGGAAGAGGSAVVAKPNDLAACQVTPGSEWILAKVIRHDPGAGIYTLADEDVESNKSKRRACDACQYYCHCIHNIYSLVV